MKFPVQLLIDGGFTPAASGETFRTESPIDFSTLAEVASAGGEDLDRAVTAARRAFDGGAWPGMQPFARGKILRRIADGIRARAGAIAEVETRNGGKTIANSLNEVDSAANVFEYYAGAMDKFFGETIPMGSGVLDFTLREPVGVVAAITPWNFPAAMITRKAAPALAAGCTFIIKPAGQTPLSALAMAELAARAGVPAGVFNVVTGGAREIGAELTSNPTVRKLTFTGSTEVGRVLMAQCAPTLKKLSMELGGNAPFIVFADADLDAAVQGALTSKYRNTGQTCVCANRLLVQDEIYDDFAARLHKAVSALKVGDGLKGPTDIGPLIDAAALAKVQEHVADARAKGGKIILGGKPHALGGTFYEPTIVTGATTAMQFAREETFGPVAPLFRFRTEAEAIRMANDTEFGLASYLYTRELARAWRCAEALEYGIVGLNTGIISTEVAPFGGVKQSGFGREGSLHGITDYLDMKYLCLAGITPLPG
jgi:succinate-semialdehyde dehydrogenase/glutarate-semialdehyde dehydrogenase